MKDVIKGATKGERCQYMDRICDGSCYAAFLSGGGIICERSHTEIRKVEALEKILEVLRNGGM